MPYLRAGPWLLLLAPALALAEDEEAPPAPVPEEAVPLDEAQPEQPPPPPPITSEAQPLPDHQPTTPAPPPPVTDEAVRLTDEQAATPAPPPPPLHTLEELSAELATQDQRFLKPKHHLLEQTPYGQIDFTAYTLEWGEVKVGLASLHVGVLPRVQLGTVPILDALGVYNVSGKWNAVRLGPLDLGATANYYALPLGDFLGTFGSAGLTQSVRLTKPWSLHGTVSYARVGARGVPDLSKVSPLLSQATGAELDSWTFKGELQPSAAAEAVMIRLATDVRFNRRDSLLLQLQATPWAHALYDLGGEPPPLLGIDQMMEYGGQFPVLQTYTATLSYQMTFRQLDLRVGGGASALPLQWVLQGNEISYRMLGETRRTEARQKRTWRRGDRAEQRPTE